MSIAADMKRLEEAYSEYKQAEKEKEDFECQGRDLPRAYDFPVDHYYREDKERRFRSRIKFAEEDVERAVLGLLSSVFEAWKGNKNG